MVPVLTESLVLGEGTKRGVHEQKIAAKIYWEINTLPQRNINPTQVSSPPVCSVDFGLTMLVSMIKRKISLKVSLPLSLSAYWFYISGELWLQDMNFLFNP